MNVLVLLPLKLSSDSQAGCTLNASSKTYRVSKLFDTFQRKRGFRLPMPWLSA